MQNIERDEVVLILTLSSSKGARDEFFSKEIVTGNWIGRFVFVKFWRE
jgi:hypothetical protein